MATTTTDPAPPPAPAPSQPPAPPPTVNHDRRRVTVWVVAVLAVAVTMFVGGVGVGVAIGRATAEPEVVSPPAKSASAIADQWVPDCTRTPTPECDVETVTRQFLAAWRAGRDTSRWTTDTATKPPNPPEGDMVRAPSISVTGDKAMALVFYPSDGTIQMWLSRSGARWVVSVVEPF